MKIDEAHDAGNDENGYDEDGEYEDDEDENENDERSEELNQNRLQGMARFFTSYIKNLALLRGQMDSMMAKTSEGRSDTLDETDDHSENQTVNQIESQKQFQRTRNDLMVKPSFSLHSCPKCERTFNSKYNVIRHLKQFHAEKRMFKCEVCGKEYKWIDSLHKHKKTHRIAFTDFQDHD